MDYLEKIDADLEGLREIFKEEAMLDMDGDPTDYLCSEEFQAEVTETFQNTMAEIRMGLYEKWKEAKLGYDIVVFKAPVPDVACRDGFWVEFPMVFEDSEAGVISEEEIRFMNFLRHNFEGIVIQNVNDSRTAQIPVTTANVSCDAILFAIFTFQVVNTPIEF